LGPVQGQGGGLYHQDSQDHYSGISMNKQYLGDGVYVETDECNGVILTTENGLEVTNRIFLNSMVYRDLVKYVEDNKALT
jgi:hypothetical protein